MKQFKRKVGRPQKPNYKPTVTIDLKNAQIEALMTKQNLGIKLTDVEFELLATEVAKRLGCKVTLTKSKKQNWFKRILKRLFRLK